MRIDSPSIMDQTSRMEIKVNKVADQERERDLMPPLDRQIIARKRVLQISTQTGRIENNGNTREAGFDRGEESRKA